MATTIEVKVPDIGGYDDVPVIELLVAVGDRVSKDQGLVTLESDKATMEVPSSAEGVVREVRVKVGDRVSEGSVILVLDAEAVGDVAPAASTASAETSTPPPRDAVASAPSNSRSPHRSARSSTAIRSVSPCTASTCSSASRSSPRARRSAGSARTR